MNIRRGIVGLLTYLVDADPVPELELAERRAICEACALRAGAFCGMCGCVLRAKTAIRREACPRKRW